MRSNVIGLGWPDMESYAGFLTIDERYDSHLYFWFFPSQSRPEKDPVILWLQVICRLSLLGPKLGLRVGLYVLVAVRDNAKGE